jgi:TetR/AcrR family transcriptional regulator of autoinduction and epiphytic fitness
VTAGSSAAAGGAGEAGGGRDHAPPELSAPGRAAPDLPALAALDQPASDGRVARGQRTRRNVAEALLGLLREGDPDPTAKAVARRAGVSLRLVFHHFADMDDLYRFVAALQLRRQWSDMPRLSPALSLPTRIERTIGHRAELFEETFAVRRALACRAPASGGVRHALDAADTLLREDLKATFAPELAALPPAARAEFLGAMDTCTSWEAWERLRRTSGVQVRGARRAMSLMLTALCARADEDDGRADRRVGMTPTAS